MLYPLILLTALLANVVFLMAVLRPRYEMLYHQLRFEMPQATRNLIDASDLLSDLFFLVPLLWMLLLVLINWALFSSWAKWHIPVLGRLYRLHARGQFLQVLGLMLQAGKPLPELLDCVVESGQLPSVLEPRVDRLACLVQRGEPLVESLAAQGLITRSMRPLILAAEKTRDLPWALQELGETLSQRCARLTYRLTMVLFPLTIFGCSCLIALVAVAEFIPLVTLMEKLSG